MAREGRAPHPRGEGQRAHGSGDVVHAAREARGAGAAALQDRQMVAVYPLIALILLLAGPVWSTPPMLVRTLVLTAVIFTLMTYVNMPRMTRLFSLWLYPDRE